MREVQSVRLHRHKKKEVPPPNKLGIVSRHCDLHPMLWRAANDRHYEQQTSDAHRQLHPPQEGAQPPPSATAQPGQVQDGKMRIQDSSGRAAPDGAGYVVSRHHERLHLYPSPSKAFVVALTCLETWSAMTKRAGARAQDERVHLSQSIAIQKAERRAHAVQCNEWRARAEAMQSGVISKAEYYHGALRSRPQQSVLRNQVAALWAALPRADRWPHLPRVLRRKVGAVVPLEQGA